MKSLIELPNVGNGWLFNIWSGLDIQPTKLQTIKYNVKIWKQLWLYKFDVIYNDFTWSYYIFNQLQANTNSFKLNKYIVCNLKLCKLYDFLF